MCCCNEEDQGCRKPENLKGKPGDCSPEQVRECHGDVTQHPCAPAGDCARPEDLKGRPQDCSPEQIKKCHGDTADHSCVGDR